jgi:hypothetical protein
VSEYQAASAREAYLPPAGLAAGGGLLIAGALPKWLDILLELIKLLIDLFTSNFPVAGPIIEIIKTIIDLVLKLVF